jgi:5-deoxy-glucuronate isomerase
MPPSDLLIKPNLAAGNGRVIHVTPVSAGWTYVGFDVWKLAAGQTAAESTGGREACLVFLSGKATVEAGGRSLGVVGGRPRPSTASRGRSTCRRGPTGPCARRATWSSACATAPAKGGKAVRVISPDDLTARERGTGTNLRRVTDILPETDPTAESLLVVEVITPAGHWSSYPPHKHDRDALPEESLLEETYYHRLRPAQGFAFQRVYTDDRSLDETIAVSDGDVTLVPRGYHPCAAPHGYDLYYLNTMAGPKRIWRFHNDPAHEWIVKPRD